MALDGMFLSTIAREIKTVAINSRVEKISQPSKEEVVITLRCRGENGQKSESKKLLISANASAPRLHFTKISLENPSQPPMFCMLLRKHLNTARLIDVTQNSLDRTINLVFEAVDELGDLTTATIIVEIMGRHSNVILVNSNKKVVDSLKRITNELSSVRMILPGITYELPPSQNKLNLLTCEIGDVLSQILNVNVGDLPKAILQTVEGISPLLARELVFNIFNGQNQGQVLTSNLSDFYKNKLKEQLMFLKQLLEKGDFAFFQFSCEKIKLRDFTFFDINQYGNTIEKTVFQTGSELLDEFFKSRDQYSRMKQRSNDLLRLIINKTDRITKKLALQETELLQTKNREELKIKGDLVNANLYRISKSQKSVVVENFYNQANPNEQIEIKLDARLNPPQNAQHYYSEYKKAQTAEKMLTELMAQSKQELIYLDSVFDSVTRTNGESELLLIREELMEQGYLKKVKAKSRMIKPQAPLKYISDDGNEIFVGRNNKQNDKLTLKDAAKNDMWLHTQGIAGSHVIIKATDKPFSNETITRAAELAAFNSKGKESDLVPVDYTLVRYVKKPTGAKPGMVIFTDYKTAYVKPKL